MLFSAEHLISGAEEHTYFKLRGYLTSWDKSGWTEIKEL